MGFDYLSLLLLVVSLFFSFYGHTCSAGRFPGRGRIRAAVEAYATAATCSLWIFNRLSKAGDWICIFMDTMLGSQPTEPQWELQFCFYITHLLDTHTYAYTSLCVQVHRYTWPRRDFYASWSLTLLWSLQSPAHKTRGVGNILRSLLSAFLKELFWRVN